MHSTLFNHESEIHSTLQYQRTLQILHTKLTRITTFDVYPPGKKEHFCGYRKTNLSKKDILQDISTYPYISCVFRIVITYLSKISDYIQCFKIYPQKSNLIPCRHLSQISDLDISIFYPFESIFIQPRNLT